jgi:hypothetical protein
MLQEETVVKKNVRTPIAIPISIIILITTCIIVIIAVCYYLYWIPSVVGPSCNNNSNCSVGQLCQMGRCSQQKCSTNNDCFKNGICINSYCTPYECNIGNDCPNNMACVSGNCVTTGTTCENNFDCYNLSCRNKTCAQCLVNSDCPIGQECFQNRCQYPVTASGNQMLFYNSLSQERGNISAPPGYLCAMSNCGTGPGRTEFTQCGTTGSCPSSCPFCIDSVCRCTSGQLYENCNSNKDCASGICSSDTIYGKICIQSGGLCAFNYTANGCTGCCPSPSLPYCVNGTCSSTSLGAICGATGMPQDLCNNPSALGVIGQTGISPDGMGFFCVNGTCQLNPGLLNQQCTFNSCQFYNEGTLNCVDNRCVQI